jgi:hypothetical protein
VGSTTTILLDKKPLAVGTHKFPMRTDDDLVSLQWVNHAAAGGASATISLFSALSDRGEDLSNTDPAANPYWSPIENSAGVPLTFPHQPAAAAGSCLVPLGAAATSRVLVVIVVAGVDYTSFSLLSRSGGS